MAQITRIGALAGVFAAATFAITPTYAAKAAHTAPAAASVYAFDFEQVAPFDTGAATGVEEAEYHRRYRRYRRNRIDGGDVVAGVLILGGIAAIASAASNNERRERVERQRYDDRRYDDRRDDDRRSNPRASDGSGIDSAVSQCLSAIERDVRVESVDGASRVASGWIVSGTLLNGLLARHAGQVLGRDDILNHLRGHEAELLTRAVDIVVSRLRRKLEPLDAIRTLRNVGYTLALRRLE